MILVFDTETTGFLKKGRPLFDQPHVVQLAGIVYDEHNGQLVAGDSLNTLIRPEDWTVPPEAEAVHGISTAQALVSGMPILEALDRFSALVEQVDLLVAHNLTYDIDVLANEYQRLGLVNPTTLVPTYCTMQLSANVCKIPSPRGSGYKWPKLAEAYRHFTGEELSGAHDAMVDVIGCAKVYEQLTQRAKAA